MFANEGSTKARRRKPPVVRLVLRSFNEGGSLGEGGLAAPKPRRRRELVLEPPKFHPVSFSAKSEVTPAHRHQHQIFGRIALSESANPGLNDSIPLGWTSAHSLHPGSPFARTGQTHLYFGGFRAGCRGVEAHYLAEPGGVPATNFEINSPGVMGCGL